MGMAATAGVAMMPRMGRAFPSVFPHGTTIYKPEKCWSGFTVFGVETAGEGCVLIDMNGNVVKEWKHVSELEHPTKILKGGYVMGATRQKPEMVGRTYGDPMSADLSICDFDGKIVRNIPLAGMHHDYQVHSSPTGYYSPTQDVLFEPDENILVLSHLFTTPEDNGYTLTARSPLDDDYIFEVDKNNKIVWDYRFSDHFDEMPFDDDFKKTMFKYPTWQVTRTPGVKAADWIHCNSMSKLGPNHWYDEDPVKHSWAHPDNIIVSNRQTQTSFIIDKKTKKIVWHIGPDYYKDSVWYLNGEPQKGRALSRLGQIVGQHHTHMIPAGLPGAGNIMIYDNGGYSGYGPRNPATETGWSNSRRDYSRVIEFNPVTLEKVWEHSAATMGLREGYKFYSDYVSSAQRLPNGNTLITNGAVGQLQEVTPDHEIVWEYISPWYNPSGNFNLVYRAYRVPYDYVPQIKKPAEYEVVPPKNTEWRLPASKTAYKG